VRYLVRCLQAEGSDTGFGLLRVDKHGIVTAYWILLEFGLEVAAKLLNFQVFQLLCSICSCHRHLLFFSLEILLPDGVHSSTQHVLPASALCDTRFNGLNGQPSKMNNDQRYSTSYKIYLNKTMNFSSTASAKFGTSAASRARAWEQFLMEEERRKNADHQRALELACIGSGRTLQQCGLRK
jgi:hypothetical protein